MGDGDSHLSILGPQGWGKAVHLLSLRLLWGAAITPETPGKEHFTTYRSGMHALTLLGAVLPGEMRLSPLSRGEGPASARPGL